MENSCTFVCVIPRRWPSPSLLVDLFVLLPRLSHSPLRCDDRGSEREGEKREKKVEVERRPCRISLLHNARFTQLPSFVYLNQVRGFLDSIVFASILRERLARLLYLAQLFLREKQRVEK
jgi:hypothetical protein